MDRRAARDATETAAVQDGQTYQDRVFRNLSLTRTTLTRIEFDGCTFERCAFAQGALYRCRFTNCRFLNCDLGMVQVTNARFFEVSFTDSKLIGIDWTKAGVSKVDRTLLTVGFEACVLDYCNFSGLSLKNTRMTRCSAKEVEFGQADLSGTDCSGTDFAGSTFLQTNLQKARLVGATNYAIDPRVNKIKGAVLSLPEAVALLTPFEVVLE